MFVGEMGINVVFCGMWGCLVLFVIGDEVFCCEGKVFLGDGLMMVLVKKGFG